MKGGCHCGRIGFEVEGSPSEVTECNCSICSRKGSLLWFVPRSQFRLLTPPNDLATYTFNKHRIQHHFCPTCGINPFAEAKDRSGKEMTAVNVRCLDDIDLASLKVTPFDGRAL